MPAPRPSNRQSVSQQLANAAPLTMPLDMMELERYYRRANLLLQQAAKYKAIGNDAQQYVMLLRFSSLVLETIKLHRDFDPKSPQYRRFTQVLATQYMPELEALKQRLDSWRLMGGEPEQPATPRPAGTVQLAASNMPQLHWEAAGAPGQAADVPSQPGAAERNDPFAFPAQRQRQSGDPFEQASAPSYPGSSLEDQFGGLQVAASAPSLDLLTGDGVPRVPGQQARQGSSSSYAGLPSWATEESSGTSFRLPAASEAARNKHAIMAQAPARRTASQQLSQQSPPLYPEFDKGPLPPVDYGYSRQSNSSSANLMDAPVPQQRQQQASLLDAYQPSPQVELQLGPQEVEVQGMSAPAGPPPAHMTCSHGPPQPALEPRPPPVEPPSETAVKKKLQIREVHVSAALMDEFLHYSRRNTAKGVESCGILAGVLDEKQGAFFICTLIIPKQEGTSDTVQALNEEEIFDVQDKRSLYPMGWIHTHPTQTCFLSSIDIHTQCGYQVEHLREQEGTMVFAGFNWFLIIVTAVIAILALGVGLYLLIIYCHPEDRNQAWFPKAVVVFGIALAIWTVLLFPLDVANRKACSAEIAYTSCNFALPTTGLWYFCYIAISVMVFGLCPFATFYYEGDSDMSLMQRVVSAVMWEGVTLCVVGLVLGICYGIWGYVEYPVMGLASGFAPLTYIDNSTSTPLNYCIRVLSDGGLEPVFTGRNCDAINGKLSTEVWTIRVSFFVYVIALVTTAGWLLFMIFAGIGLVALPLDLIREFLGRPRSTISKTEYLAKAKGLGQRAKNIMDSAAKLRKQDREGGRNRSWRREYRLLTQQVVALEEDEKALDVVYPQGTDPDYAWAVFVIMSYVKFIIGLLGVGLSLCWMLQVVLYLFVYPPVTPFLNVLFIRLDNVFPLFGVIAFALFCFWLLACTIKGCTKFGLNFLIFTVHPMKYGATLMSSFLFNVALVLLSCTAAIQFCAQAFSQYANETAIASIFGGQILYLKGLKYLYRLHVFLYSMFAFIGLAAVYLSIRGPQKWKRYNIEDVYANT